MLCWRWWSLNLCLYLRCSRWWEVQTSRLSKLGRFSTRWDLSALRGQTWVLRVLFFCLFFCCCCCFLIMFAKDLTCCFSHCCVEGGYHWIYVCIFVANDGERCKLPAYHSLEGFQHVGIFQLFQVKLESCVFWLAVFFFFSRRRRKVIISKSWSLPMSAPGKLRVLAVFTPDRKRFLTRM